MNDLLEWYCFQPTDSELFASSLFPFSFLFLVFERREILHSTFPYLIMHHSNTFIQKISWWYIYYISVSVYVFHNFSLSHWFLVFPWLLISNYRPNTTPWTYFSVVFVFSNDDNNDMRISLDKICCQVLISRQLHLDFQWQLTMNQRGKSLQELRDIFSQCDVDSDGRLKATVR